MERTLGVFLADEPAQFQPVFDIFQRLVADLNAIHSAHLSHEALTPDTVGLDGAGQPIVKTMSYGPTTNETVVFRKTKYCAPDAFISSDQGASSCESIDCYITGFIFYEILIGKRLFREQFAALEDGSPSLWFKWHIDKSAKVRPLKELRPDLGRFAEVVDGMLEKDPAKRTQSLLSVASLLTDVGGETNEKKKDARGGPKAAFAPVTPHPQFHETVIRPKPASTSSTQQSPKPERTAAPAGSKSSAPSKFSIPTRLVNPWLVISALVGLALGLMAFAYFSPDSLNRKRLPAIKYGPAQGTPSPPQASATAEIFENPTSWIANADGSYTHTGPGNSFLLPFTNSVTFEFLTDAAFVLNYQSESQYIRYSLSHSALNRSIRTPSSGGAGVRNVSIPLVFAASTPIRLKFQWLPQKTRIFAVPSGETLDSVRTSSRGKFGFSGLVTFKILPQ